MQLPEWLNSQLWQELETIEESKKVQYITSVERIGIAKGVAIKQIISALQAKSGTQVSIHV